MIDRLIQNLKNKQGYGTNQGIVLSGKDIELLVNKFTSINYLIAHKTFTFTEVNTCNVTPLTIATPSAPSKTMLPIAFYYTQQGMGDGFGVSFVIEMTNPNSLTQPVASSNTANLSIELPKIVSANMGDNTIEAGEEFFLTSDGTGGGTAGTVTITTIYIEI